MKGGNANKPEEEKEDPGNLRAEEISTNERARVLPWFCGEQKLGLFWIGQPFDQYTVEAEDKASKK